MSTKEKPEPPEFWKKPIFERFAELKKLESEEEKLGKRLKEVRARIKEIRQTDKHLMTVVGAADRFDLAETDRLEDWESRKNSEAGDKKRKVEETKSPTPKKGDSRARLEKRIRTEIAPVDKTLQTDAEKK